MRLFHLLYKLKAQSGFLEFHDFSSIFFPSFPVSSLYPLIGVRVRVLFSSLPFIWSIILFWCSSMHLCRVVCWFIPFDPLMLPLLYARIDEQTGENCYSDTARTLRFQSVIQMKGPRGGKGEFNLLLALSLLDAYKKNTASNWLNRVLFFIFLFLQSLNLESNEHKRSHFSFFFYLSILIYIWRSSFFLSFDDFELARTHFLIC